MEIIYIQNIQKALLLIVFILSGYMISIAQGVAINSTGANPDASAAFDIQSSTGGFLLPRMTGNERLSIPSPALGLMVFDTDMNTLFQFNGSEWESFVPSSTVDNLQNQILELQISTGILVKDADGNTYKTVKIGSQRWMAENIKTTKTKQGTPIPLISDNQTWANTASEAYCWYNNDSISYGTTYGVLYNYYAATSVCPEGWHLPSEADWNILFAYLGSNDGGKIKEGGTLHWNSPNTGANNESGFTALPAGGRGFDGNFLGIGNSAFWWSSTLDYLNSYLPIFYMVKHDSGMSDSYSNFLEFGISVRCLQD